MKKIIILGVSLFLSFVHFAGAETVSQESATPATTVESSQLIKTSPLTVAGTLTVPSASGIVGKPFVLDGTKSQDDGVVHTFLWRQVSGPTVPLSSASALTLSVTPTVAGTYVFELVVTDSIGLTSVAQKSEFIIGNDAPTVKTTPISPDPDFDLSKKAPPPPPPPPPKGLPGGDSGVSELSETLQKTVPTVSNEGRDRIRDTDQSPEDGKITGDPDFDLLNIEIGGDDLEKFRADVSPADPTKKVIVRGWDPEKKEEIVARPQDVKTPEDLKIYVEAVALNDVAIKGIKIKENVIEMESREQGKLFGFIPVEMSSNVIVKYNLRDSTEDRADLVKVKFPWWHVFVKKGYKPDTLEAEIEKEIEASEVKKNDDASLQDKTLRQTQDKLSQISETLQLVSNIMKTKHDTAKNSISNVR